MKSWASQGDILDVEIEGKFPAYISPNGDGCKDEVEGVLRVYIKPVASLRTDKDRIGNSGVVVIGQVRLTDEDGNIVMETEGEFQPGSLSPGGGKEEPQPRIVYELPFVWDGKYPAGSEVPEGIYSLTVHAGLYIRNPQGRLILIDHAEDTDSVEIVVDRTPPKVEIVQEDENAVVEYYDNLSGVDLGSLGISVNGKDVTASAEVTPSSASVNIGSLICAEVEVFVRDRACNQEYNRKVIGGGDAIEPVFGRSIEEVCAIPDDEMEAFLTQRLREIRDSGIYTVYTGGITFPYYTTSITSPFLKVYIDGKEVDLFRTEVVYISPSYKGIPLEEIKEELYAKAIKQLKESCPPVLSAVVIFEYLGGADPEPVTDNMEKIYGWIYELANGFSALEPIAEQIRKEIPDVEEHPFPKVEFELGPPFERYQDIADRVSSLFDEFLRINGFHQDPGDKFVIRIHNPVWETCEEFPFIFLSFVDTQEVIFNPKVAVYLENVINRGEPSYELQHEALLLLLHLFEQMGIEHHSPDIHCYDITLPGNPPMSSCYADSLCICGCYNPELDTAIAPCPGTPEECEGWIKGCGEVAGPYVVDLHLFLTEPSAWFEKHCGNIEQCGQICGGWEGGCGGVSCSLIRISGLHLFRIGGFIIFLLIPLLYLIVMRRG